MLHCPYTAEKAKLIVREMTDLLVMDLVDKGLVTDQMVLTIGYDRESLQDPQLLRKYQNAITRDHYGRSIPKHAHGTANLPRKTASTRLITDAVMALYDRIIAPDQPDGGPCGAGTGSGEGRTNAAAGFLYGS